MASSNNLLFTSTNYFQWKSYMEDLLSKGLYQITLGKEKEPIDANKKVKWANRNDEAHGLIKMSISPHLRLHLKEIDDPMKLGKRLNLCLVNTILFEHNS
jgi:hypothetical protein